MKFCSILSLGLVMAHLSVAALLACGDSTSPRNPAVYTISPTTQWSGGTVQVTSASFAGPTLPVFTAAGETLAVARVDNSTIAVRLPRAPSGSISLLREGADQDTVGTIQVVGLRNARLVPGSLGYEPLVPAGITPLIFLAEAVPAGPTALTILDPATDQLTTLSGVRPVHTAFGVVPSYQANRFVLRDSINQVGVWELFPAPSFQSLAAVQNHVSRHVTQLADTLWLTLFSDDYQVTTSGGTLLPVSVRINDPIRVVFSPSGNRVALVILSAPNGQVPVLDPGTGDTAFTVPLASAQGVAFSPHADRLYLASKTNGNAPDSLIAVSASAGQRLAGVTLPSGYSGWNLVADPSVDRLYQVADSSGTLALLVFDGATLALEGQLLCPGQCGNSAFPSAGLMVDAAAGRIHVAYPGSPIPVITFDRLP